MDILDFTIETALNDLKNKKLSSFELTNLCLTQIKNLNHKFNVFLTVDEEAALKEAKKADEMIARGVDKDLLGIPVALKDLFTSSNLRTTAGSKIIDNYIPPYDATVTRKLKEAGAIIIGKTNQDAWGHGSSGENTDYLPTKNPYDETKVPGGSSSGSAVAVASGMSLAATGTDTGSSVRLPASFCNLVGIKPTYGRVSRYGIIAMASSFDTIGHMTKTVYDNAYIYEITAGKDELDASTVNVPVPKYTSFLGKSINRMKIGLPKEYFRSEGIEKDVQVTIDKALKEYKKLGAEVVEVSLPNTDYAMACYYILVPSEVSSNLSRYDGVRFGHGREVFGDEAERRITIGTYALSSGYYDAFYKKAAKVRTLIKNDFEEAFKQVDLIAAPVCPTKPFDLGEKSENPLSMYLSDIFVCPVNIAGVPAISVPAGFSNNLPIGLQLIGPQFAEERIFQTAYAYERETEWYKAKPKL